MTSERKSSPRTSGKRGRCSPRVYTATTPQGPRCHPIAQRSTGRGGQVMRMGCRADPLRQPPQIQRGIGRLRVKIPGHPPPLRPSSVLPSATRVKLAMLHPPRSPPVAYPSSRHPPVSRRGVGALEVGTVLVVGVPGCMVVVGVWPHPRRPHIAHRMGMRWGTECRDTSLRQCHIPHTTSHTIPPPP